jgi:hypothetical protein
LAQEKVRIPEAKAGWFNLNSEFFSPWQILAVEGMHRSRIGSDPQSVSSGLPFLFQS